MAIKKYSKVKFTLRKELIIIAAAIVVMIVATILFNLPNKEEKFLEKWNTAGSTITENMLYEEVELDELKDVIKANEYVFVLFATTEDAASVAVFDKVYSLALNTYEMETVYLVDEKLEESEATALGVTFDQTTNLCAFKDGKLVAEADQDLVTDKASDWTAAIVQILNYSKEQ